ncbi:MAG: hypothetical protein JO165_01460 [Candidatus Eremiobacteraeota bacterium]|nr:hypothetical protein [Candidatus Eremiobacteraeota bacterium]
MVTLAFAVSANALSNAATWHMTSPPSLSSFANVLQSVRAFSDTNVYAVGVTQSALIDHWNGLRWTRTVLILPGASSAIRLDVVAGIAPTDMWVGGNQPMGSSDNPFPMLYHFIGRGWHYTPLPALPAGFSGNVIAINPRASNDVWALVDVNNFSTATESTLIEHWNGTSWSMTLYPRPAFGTSSAYTVRLQAIQALSPTNVWVVGYTPAAPGALPDGEQIIEHYNGSYWRVVPNPPVPASNTLARALHSVWGMTAANVWAVGEFQILVSGDLLYTRTYAIHWNGATWSNVYTPNYPMSSMADNTLQAVSGPASGDAANVWAVGYAFGKYPLAFHFNGSSWAFSQWPPTYAPTALNAVDVIGTNDVWAVGANDLADTVDVADHYAL